MEAFEVLALARVDFERPLQAVGPDDWSKSTPCTDWKVHDLVNHVVAGNIRYTMLLQGASADDLKPTRGPDYLGDDASAAFARTADEVMAAYEEPGVLGKIVHHPSADMSGRTLLSLRILEFTAHGWDLRRAIGADETLDPSAVQFLWDLGPVLEMVREKGFFSPVSASVGPDAPLQSRLLHLMGRTP